MAQAFEQNHFPNPDDENLRLITYAFTEPGFASHWHHYIELLYVRKGRYRVQVGGESLEVDENQLVFINSEEIHSTLQLRPDCMLQVIQFYIGLFAETATNWYETRYALAFIRNELPLKRLTRVGKDDYLNVLLDNLHEDYEKKRFCYELSIKAEISLILICLLRDAQNDALPAPALIREMEKLKPVLNYIKENYMEPIHQEDMARRVYMCASSFCRQFKRLTGKTLIDYVNDIRVVEAQKLLLSTSSKMIQIASQVGFGNVTYFNRIFKRYTGTTPMAYREQGLAQRNEIGRGIKPA